MESSYTDTQLYPATPAGRGDGPHGHQPLDRLQGDDADGAHPEERGRHPDLDHHDLQPRRRRPAPRPTRSTTPPTARSPAPVSATRLAPGRALRLPRAAPAGRFLSTPRDHPRGVALLRPLKSRAPAADEAPPAARDASRRGWASPARHHHLRRTPCLNRLRSRARSHYGFTLIELLVVVLIIGIGENRDPAVHRQKDKANTAAAVALVRDATVAMESSYTDTQTYPATPAAAVTALAAINPDRLQGHHGERHAPQERGRDPDLDGHDVQPRGNVRLQDLHARPRCQRYGHPHLRHRLHLVGPQGPPRAAPAGRSLNASGSFPGR